MTAWTKARHDEWKAKMAAYGPGDPTLDMRARLFLEEVRDAIQHIEALEEKLGRYEKALQQLAGDLTKPLGQKPEFPSGWGNEDDACYRGCDMADWETAKVAREALAAARGGRDEEPKR
jgi:hypothetical protein